MKPKNVLLSGKDAAHIFPFYKDKKLGDMDYQKYHLDDEGNETTNLIPLHHFSWTTHYKRAADGIKEAIRNGYCNY